MTHLRDRYLSLHQIQCALARFTYKPGWTFTADRHPFEGVTIRIIARGIPDAYNPGDTIDIGIDEFLPPVPDVDYLWRWLEWRVGRFDAHERREAIQVDGRRIYNPHVEATA